MKTPAKRTDVSFHLKPVDCSGHLDYSTESSFAITLTFDRIVHYANRFTKFLAENRDVNVEVCMGDIPYYLDVHVDDFSTKDWELGKAPDEYYDSDRDITLFLGYNKITHKLSFRLRYEDGYCYESDCIPIDDIKKAIAKGATVG